LTRHEVLPICVDGFLTVIFPEQFVGIIDICDDPVANPNPLVGQNPVWLLESDDIRMNNYHFFILGKAF
jgi:hypothetical protein